MSDALGRGRGREREHTAKVEQARAQEHCKSSSAIHIRRFVRKENIMCLRCGQEGEREQGHRMVIQSTCGGDGSGGLLSRLSSLITLSGIAQRLRKNAALSVTHHVRCKQRWGTRRREWVQRGRIRRRSCPHSGSELQCNFSVITERKSMGGTRGEGEAKGRTQRVGGRHAPQIQILIFPRSVG